MQPLNEQQLSSPPSVGEVSSNPGEALPGRHTRGMRTAAMFMLAALLIVIFGTGLFAGWVFGTQSIRGIQPGVTPATNASAILSGTTLDAIRAAAVEKVRPAVVQVNVMTNSGAGLGSGVIFDSRGYIVTNNHVIAGAQRIQITLYDGTSLEARLIGTDQLDDLAVVQVSTTAKLKAATLGDSSKLQVGQEVLAIGNPLGITQTVTSGIISALDRAVSTIPDAVQTDAAINPGNSGGALVDLQGNLMGIPTLSAIDPQFQTPANGVGFAIPSNRVRLIAPQLILTGKVTHSGRAALGIQITSVDASLAAEHKLSVTAGVLIIGVATAGPAVIAGLKPGDVIVRIGADPVTDSTGYADALLPLNAGNIVPVSIYRGKEQLTINVTAGEAQAS